MKCTCPKCNSSLFIEREGLQGLKRPQFSCPKCFTKILIRPSKGKCGSCNTTFRYYDFMFPKENAIVPCPNCGVKNRLFINY